MHFEVQHASQSVIDVVNELGGSVKIVYHTPTTLVRHLKPHKFWKKEIKTPMPPPKKVLQMEKMRDKGCLVEYPTAPWYDEYKTKIDEASRIASERKKTIGEQLVPKIPMDRFEGQSDNIPRAQRPVLQREYKYPWKK